MPQPKFQVYKHCKIHGKWRYCRAAVFSNNKIKPHVIVVGGREEKHEDGSYCIRHKDSWIDAGTDPLEAQRMRSKLLDQEEYTAPQPGAAPTEIEKAPALDETIEKYLRETEANLSKGTLKAYRNSLTKFRQGCRKATADDIDRDDVLAFKVWLKAHDHTERQRSVYNNFLNLMIFLRWWHEKEVSEALGVSDSDWPPKLEREPEAYTEEELEKLFAEADDEERLLLKCFLCSGLRSGELEHLRYGDIDFLHSLWAVRHKTNHNLKTDNSQRDVITPEWLTGQIAERMEAGKKKKPDLIFPNSKDEPDGHLLRVVKNVACRAKLLTKVGGDKYEGDLRVDDHKFRSTAATLKAEEGCTVQDLMDFMGWKDPKIAMRYLAKANKRKAEVRARATAPFSKFAPKPQIVKTGT